MKKRNTKRFITQATTALFAFSMCYGFYQPIAVAEENEDINGYQTEYTYEGSGDRTATVSFNLQNIYSINIKAKVSEYNIASSQYEETDKISYKVMSTTSNDVYVVNYAPGSAYDVGFSSKLSGQGASFTVTVEYSINSDISTGDKFLLELDCLNYTESGNKEDASVVRYGRKINVIKAPLETAKLRKYIVAAQTIIGIFEDFTGEETIDNTFTENSFDNLEAKLGNAKTQLEISTNYGKEDYNNQEQSDIDTAARELAVAITELTKDTSSEIALLIENIKKAAEALDIELDSNATEKTAIQSVLSNLLSALSGYQTQLDNQEKYNIMLGYVGSINDLLTSLQSNSDLLESYEDLLTTLAGSDYLDIDNFSNMTPQEKQDAILDVVQKKNLTIAEYESLLNDVKDKLSMTMEGIPTIGQYEEAINNLIHENTLEVLRNVYTSNFDGNVDAYDEIQLRNAINREIQSLQQDLATSNQTIQNVCSALGLASNATGTEILAEIQRLKVDESDARNALTAVAQALGIETENLSIRQIKEKCIDEIEVLNNTLEKYENTIKGFGEKIGLEKADNQSFDDYIDKILTRVDLYATGYEKIVIGIMKLIEGDSFVLNKDGEYADTILDYVTALKDKKEALEGNLNNIATKLNGILTNGGISFDVQGNYDSICQGLDQLESGIRGKLDEIYKKLAENYNKEYVANKTISELLSIIQGDLVPSAVNAYKYYMQVVGRYNDYTDAEKDSYGIVKDEVVMSRIDAEIEKKQLESVVSVLEDLANNAIGIDVTQIAGYHQTEKSVTYKDNLLTAIKDKINSLKNDSATLGIVKDYLVSIGAFPSNNPVTTESIQGAVESYVTGQSNLAALNLLEELAGRDGTYLGSEFYNANKENVTGENSEKIVKWKEILGNKINSLQAESTRLSNMIQAVNGSMLGNILDSANTVEQNTALINEKINEMIDEGKRAQLVEIAGYLNLTLSSDATSFAYTTAIQGEITRLQNSDNLLNDVVDYLNGTDRKFYDVLDGKTVVLGAAATDSQISLMDALGKIDTAYGELKQSLYEAESKYSDVINTIAIKIGDVVGVAVEKNEQAILTALENLKSQYDSLNQLRNDIIGISGLNLSDSATSDMIIDAIENAVNAKTDLENKVSAYSNLINLMQKYTHKDQRDDVLKNDIQNAINTLDDLEKAAAQTIKSYIDTLETDIEEQKEEYNRLYSRYQALLNSSGGSGSGSGSDAALRAQLQEANNTIRQLQSQVDGMNAQIDALQKQIKDYESSDIGTLKNLLANSETKVKELEEQLQKAQAERDELLVLNEEANNKISVLQESVDIFSKKYEKLESERTQLLKQKDSLNQTITALEEQLASLRKRPDPNTLWIVLTIVCSSLFVLAILGDIYFLFIRGKIKKEKAPMIDYDITQDDDDDDENDNENHEDSAE